jgi:hypothetical protein
MPDHESCAKEQTLEGAMQAWAIQNPICSISFMLGHLRGGLLADALSQATDEQIDEELNNRGIARPDLFHPLHATASHRIRLARMLGVWQIGVNRAVAEHWQELKAADEQCSQCESIGRCERWLEWGQINAAPMSFCPNASLWVAIASEHGVESPAYRADSRERISVTYRDIVTVTQEHPQTVRDPDAVSAAANSSDHRPATNRN